MAKVNKIGACLWFDDEAEQAAKFYTSVFKNSAIGRTSRYGKAGQEVHRRPPGSVMTVEFELDGQQFVALNGGPVFKFNEAVSFMVTCDDQAEIDHYWNKLSEGGDPKAQQCGWLKDKFGLSWQIVPKALAEMMSGPDPKKSERAMAVLMNMKKLDVAELKKAYDG
jgi:predicted 3-demethylubiquinone-9 3-methyltransferase (glyoxalase superfamily)